MILFDEKTLISYYKYLVNILAACHLALATLGIILFLLSIKCKTRMNNACEPCKHQMGRTQVTHI